MAKILKADNIQCGPGRGATDTSTRHCANRQYSFTKAEYTMMQQLHS